ncbi:hypothetical protein HHK36_017028 [Tetracentron sinense]|uniref:PABC domain-containing protein n=1 Tax=Tetracentron sinense TaxID=13715 RepID=A0A835DET3_TETSI|nr:hypothetical protein HHK36_017028 [Tetracentron sinense]
MSILYLQHPNLRDAQPILIGALAANATLEQQSRMLGENLYSLVDQMEHDVATMVLLEMDQTEVLHLLELLALKAKIVEVMRSVA